MNSKNVIKLTYKIEQSYLELARSFLYADIRWEKTADTKVTFTENTGLALLALTYVFSHASITAFAFAQLGQIRPDSPLKTKSLKKKCRTVGDLLKSRDSDLKRTLNELCLQLEIVPISKANPQLWDALLNLTQKVRHFFIHPKPDTSEFSEIMNLAGNKKWNEASEIAERVIGYFYEKTGSVKPHWLNNNTEFRIESIKALKVKTFDALE